MMCVMLAVIEPQMRIKLLGMLLFALLGPLAVSADDLSASNDAARVSLAIHHPMPDADQALLGRTRMRTLVYEDTFAELARREGVGFGALQRANPDVDAWLPGAGTELLVPAAVILPDTPREGIVVNLSELKLFYFQPEAGLVSIYPIGVGDEGTETPLMKTVITSKIENPTWYPPPSIRARHARAGRDLPAVVPPGPDNPLGPFALQLARDGYFIHGTNQAMGVGRRVSSGCIRLYNPHITDLVRRVGVGQQVRVVDQPYKVAWHEGSLYLEAHPALRTDGVNEAAEDGGQSINHTGFVAQIIRATRQRAVQLDWPLAFATAQAGRGVPVKISL